MAASMIDVCWMRLLIQPLAGQGHLEHPPTSWRVTIRSPCSQPHSLPGFGIHIRYTVEYLDGSNLIYWIAFGKFTTKNYSITQRCNNSKRVKELWLPGPALVKVKVELPFER